MNLSECGLFIRLHVSTRRIAAPAPGSDHWFQRCCGFGDLHLIRNSKDDILYLLQLCIWRNCGLIWHQAWQQLLVFPDEKLQQFLLPPPANSSKPLGATNQLTAALPSTGHLQATSALCSSPYKQKHLLSSLSKCCVTQNEFLMLGPHHHYQLYTHTHTHKYTGEKRIPSLVIVRPDWNSFLPSIKKNKLNIYSGCGGTTHGPHILWPPLVNRQGI